MLLEAFTQTFVENVLLLKESLWVIKLVIELLKLPESCFLFAHLLLGRCLLSLLLYELLDPLVGIILRPFS